MPRLLYDRVVALQKLALEAAAEHPEGCPRVRAALDALQAATLAELRPDRKRCGRGRLHRGVGARLRGRPLHVTSVWRQRAYRLGKEVASLRQALAKHEAAKATGGRVAEEWLLRVITCAPHTSARALEEGFRLATGTDACTISRKSMGSIKSAWIEMYRDMEIARAHRLIARQQVDTGSQNGKFHSVVLTHVQDEADLRLLSADLRDGPAVPRRGRASKVQVNVLDLWAKDQRVSLPEELQALGNKTAATLATCFESLLRRVSSGALPATGGMPETWFVLPATGDMPETWFVHVMTGDGIPTNEASGKMLWSCIQQKPLAQNCRYFLIMVKCGNHQAALTAKYAVVGDGAKAVSSDKSYADVTSTAVRLFKYCIGDYYEEFVRSIRCHVYARLDDLPTEIGSLPQAASLQELYTEHVVPDAVLRHIAGVLSLSAATRADVVDSWVKFLVGYILKPDDHPTLTRFFTFRGCVDRMVLVSILGLASEVFVVQRVEPRPENAKRLTAIQKFFRDASAMQALRRASLNLQLTGGVEALMASSGKDGEPPPVVRLVNGVVHAVVVERLRRLLTALHLDPSLDIGPATGGMMY